MSGDDFTGRTALITGAASGIGAALANWLDEHNIGEIVAVDIDEAGLNALDLSCQIRRIAGDVSDPKLWEDIEGQIGRLDHALLNAGIADGCPLVDQSFAGWRRMLGINLDGVFLGLRTALRVMQRHGDGKSIVLTSSVVGVKPTAFTAAYGTSKAGVAHLAKIAAAEHLQDRIRINAVAPGRVDTPIWTKTAQFQKVAAEIGHEAALAEAGSDAGGDYAFTSADHIAAQIGYLLSDAADNITGTVLVSDGGYSLS